MYLVNRAAWPMAVGAVTVLAVGIGVLLRERRAVVARTFGLFMLLAAVWLGALAWMLSAIDESAAWSWARVAQAAFALMPVAYTHFLLALLRIDSPLRRRIGLWWGIALVFSIAGALGPPLIISLSAYGWGYYPFYGWLGVPLAVWLACWWLATMRVLGQTHRAAAPESPQRGRIMNLLMACALLGFVASDLVAGFGVPVYPWGTIAVPLCFLVGASMLLRSRFAHITPALASQQILETMNDALLVFDRERILQLVNPATEEMFGYPARELVGQSLASIDDLLFEGHLQRLLAVLPAKDRPIPYTPKQGGLRTVSCSLAMMRDRASRPLGLVCVARDITESKQLEKQAQLLQSILLVATQADDADAALSVAMRKVCDQTGWVFAEAWQPDPRGEALVASPAWCSRLTETEPFRKAAHGLRVRPGEGVAGQAWSSKQPVWTAQLADDPRILRAGQASGKLLRSAMAIPVVDADEVMAVMVFYACESSSTDARLMPVVNAIALHLGAVLRSKRAEAGLRTTYEQLGRRVSERTAELSEVNTRLQRESALHERVKRRLALQYAVVRILAEATSAQAAVAALLQEIAQTLGWTLGLFWTLDEERGLLRCRDTWQTPGAAPSQLERASRQWTFLPSVGLPGRVWAQGRAAWIEDVLRDGNFPRAPHATADGLRAALAFPVRLGPVVHGVMEFFCPEPAAPDEDLLRVVDSLGSQIGQFLDRRRAEAQLVHGQRELSDPQAVDAVCARLLEIEAVAWIHDAKTLRVLAANPAALQAFGYSASELRGRSVRELMPVEALSDGRSSAAHPLAYRRKDGTVLRVEAAWSPLTFQGRRATIVVARPLQRAPGVLTPETAERGVHAEAEENLGRR